MCALDWLFALKDEFAAFQVENPIILNEIK